MCLGTPEHRPDRVWRMADLPDAIAAEAARTAFSGVVRVDRGEETLVAQAFGLADRGIGHARTSSTSRCSGQATAGSTRRPPISRGSGQLFAGEIVSVDAVAEMVRARSDWPEEKRRYGLGFHLHETTDVVWLEGYDAGVSFTSTHEADRRITATVISNTAEGAWPFVQLLDRELGI